MFVIMLWKGSGPTHRLTNGNNPYGHFTREEAEQEAAYWRLHGFGAVLVKSHYQ